nr:unnamed protein product [Digitaria exilis]
MALWGSWGALTLLTSHGVWASQPVGAGTDAPGSKNGRDRGEAPWREDQQGEAQRRADRQRGGVAEGGAARGGAVEAEPGRRRRAALTREIAVEWGGPEECGVCAWGGEESG